MSELLPLASGGVWSLAALVLSLVVLGGLDFVALGYFSIVLSVRQAALMLFNSLVLVPMVTRERHEEPRLGLTRALFLSIGSVALFVSIAILGFLTSYNWWIFASGVFVAAAIFSEFTRKYFHIRGRHGVDLLLGVVNLVMVVLPPLFVRDFFVLGIAGPMFAAGLSLLLTSLLSLLPEMISGRLHVDFVGGRASKDRVTFSLKVFLMGLFHLAGSRGPLWIAFLVGGPAIAGFLEAGRQLSVPVLISISAMSNKYYPAVGLARSVESDEQRRGTLRSLSKRQLGTSLVIGSGVLLTAIVLDSSDVSVPGLTALVSQWPIGVVFVLAALVLAGYHFYHFSLVNEMIGVRPLISRFWQMAVALLLAWPLASAWIEIGPALALLGGEIVAALVTFVILKRSWEAR